VVVPEFALIPRTTAGAADHDIGIEEEEFARKAFGVFITLVGLAGPLLKRCREYNVSRGLKIRRSLDLGDL
jgi:hypothetical protein